MNKPSGDMKRKPSNPKHKGEHGNKEDHITKSKLIILADVWSPGLLRAALLNIVKL